MFQKKITKKLKPVVNKTNNDFMSSLNLLYPFDSANDPFIAKNTYTIDNIDVKDLNYNIKNYKKIFLNFILIFSIFFILLFGYICYLNYQIHFLNNKIEEIQYKK